jgi:hypothetical protein
MTATKVRRLLTVLVCGIVHATALDAGSFLVTQVPMENWNSCSVATTRDRIIGGARAQYFGSVDSNDNYWGIWNVTRDGTEGEWTGLGANGSDIVSGLVIDCPIRSSCSTDACISRCGEGGSGDNWYQGTGYASIFHQFTPEIDELEGAQRSLNCGGGSAPPDDQDGCFPYCSPIIIHLGPGHFDLTDASNGVAFDLGADGNPEQLAWTSPTSRDVFLTLDRNGNGSVDHGLELFGNFTPQATSAEPNGYAALAVFDQPENGGDQDGLITRRDVIFMALRLWLDGNHDGESQAWELVPLDAARVSAIDLDPVLSERRDRHGNLFRWISRVRIDGRWRLASADVILASLPAGSP